MEFKIGRRIRIPKDMPLTKSENWESDMGYYLGLEGNIITNYGEDDLAIEIEFKDSVRWWWHKEDFTEDCFVIKEKKQSNNIKNKKPAEVKLRQVKKIHSFCCYLYYFYYRYF